MEEPKADIGSLVWGLFFLVFGIGHEVFANPLQPITHVPGLALVPVGGGIAVALISRKHGWAGHLLFFLLLLLVAVYMSKAATSVLPLCLLIVGVGLSRFGLSLVQE